MAKIWITSALLAVADEIERAILFVDTPQLGDVPFPAGDLRLQPTGGEVVQIKLTPVVALREPDHLVRRGQSAPIGHSVARLVLGGYVFAEYVANCSGRSIGDAQHLVLVIARCRHECDARSIGIPLHVGPTIGATADDVIAQRRAMRIGRHLQTNNAPNIDIDHDAVNHGDRAVAGERILPRLQFRMADLRRDEVHVADVPLVLLERRDSPRVRRPDHDRSIAPYPAGVVGCVAKILLAVGGELGLATGCDIPNPEIVIANERRALAVRRRYFGTRPGHARRRPKTRDLTGIERSAAAIGLGTARQSIASREVDQNELIPTAANRIAIAESIVAQPDRLDAHPRDER